jgi:hypothetical protein
VGRLNYTESVVSSAGSNIGSGSAGWGVCDDVVWFNLQRTALAGGAFVHHGRQHVMRRLHSPNIDPPTFIPASNQLRFAADIYKNN